MSDFRGEVRAWLEANCPASMRSPCRGEAEWVWGGRRARFFSDDARLWLERMAARGWTAPTWPRQYGGGGLAPDEATILDEELRRIDARAPLKSFGLWMLGPVLLEFGSEEQRAEHLPKIVRGEIRWCQGYSETGAGSDLAALETRAVRDPSDDRTWIVDGHKIWTSHADKADWMFCLVRTDASATKHEGISFLLFDMQSPGVSVVPIRLISGASPFCQTFFDGVRVPAANLVGRPGQGWTIAKALLKHERALIAQARDTATAEEEPLEAMARRYDVLGDPLLRDRVTQANLDSLCFTLTLRRSAETAQSRGQPGPESSMQKLYGTELNKRRKELRVAIAGYRGIGWEEPGFAPEELQLVRDWLRSRANSIEGGTSEIQLNIIARRVLGLGDGRS
ncbi:MAG: acyl-CoA dehydrogenase [Myxococcales bacterium]|nr:acyl-CoA dehydrogenase [Myxococcales bacterium]